MSGLPMKNNTLGRLLVSILFACAILATWASVRYFFSMREAQRLQGRAIAINNVRSAAQALANEAVEYSKRNPAIDPILQQFDIKPKPTNAPAPGAVPPK
jgi:hypothetical protein